MLHLDIRHVRIVQLEIKAAKDRCDGDVELGEGEANITSVSQSVSQSVMSKVPK
jgi:hypothetical protein